jgi:hypothetical protein
MRTDRRRLNRLGWIVFTLAVLEGGWMAFDGGHALVTGDYVTPRSGRFAGQLGLWAHLVSAAGIEPRSALMKLIHLILGTVWLDAALWFALGLPWSRVGILVCAILSLWYLPFGTLLSLVQIVLLAFAAVHGTES